QGRRHCRRRPARALSTGSVARTPCLAVDLQTDPYQLTLRANRPAPVPATAGLATTHVTVANEPARCPCHLAPPHQSARPFFRSRTAFLALKPEAALRWLAMSPSPTVPAPKSPGRHAGPPSSAGNPRRQSS